MRRVKMLLPDLLLLKKGSDLNGVKIRPEMDETALLKRHC